jgi:hypothetical protein
MNPEETERAELIAALHQAATFGERLLKLTERLLDALTTGENRPDSEELSYLRVGVSRVTVARTDGDAAAAAQWDDG